MATIGMMEQRVPALAICTGRVTATAVNPSTSMKHLPVYFSVPTGSFQASKTTNQGAPMQLSRAHHVLDRVPIKAVPRGGGKRQGESSYTQEC